MRCPDCASVQHYRQSGMICRKCGYRYALDPKEAPRIGDRSVRRTAARLGANGRPFTVNQLVAAIARRRRWYLGLTATTRKRRFVETRSAIERLHGAARLPGLIVRPVFGWTAPSPWSEPDLLDYGAERLLVVDAEEIVDLLVLSNVHLAAKALVLSLGGYPAHITELARRLVVERPDTPVYVLHAAVMGSDAAEMPRARALLGAPSSTTIVDFGLDPGAVKKIRALRWARRLATVPADCLPHTILVGGLVRAMVEGGRLGVDDDAEADPWWRRFDDDYG